MTDGFPVSTAGHQQEGTGFTFFQISARPSSRSSLTGASLRRELTFTLAAKTTQTRNLGCKQRISGAAKDCIGIGP
jgi:hypothetical protein